MTRVFTPKPGWLQADLDRAAKRVAEWLSQPITQAQIGRAKERASDDRPDSR